MAQHTNHDGDKSEHDDASTSDVPRDERDSPSTSLSDLEYNQRRLLTSVRTVREEQDRLRHRVTQLECNQRAAMQTAAPQLTTASRPAHVQTFDGVVILRIDVQPDGSRTIQFGNLFQEDAQLSSTADRQGQPQIQQQPSGPDSQFNQSQTSRRALDHDSSGSDQTGRPAVTFGDTPARPPAGPPPSTMQHVASSASSCMASGTFAGMSSSQRAAAVAQRKKVQASQKAVENGNVSSQASNSTPSMQMQGSLSGLETIGNGERTSQARRHTHQHAEPDSEKQSSPLSDPDNSTVTVAPRWRTSATTEAPNQLANSDASRHDTPASTTSIIKAGDGWDIISVSVDQVGESKFAKDVEDIDAVTKATNAAGGRATRASVAQASGVGAAGPAQTNNRTARQSRSQSVQVPQPEAQNDDTNVGGPAKLTGKSKGKSKLKAAAKAPPPTQSQLRHQYPSSCGPQQATGNNISSLKQPHVPGFVKQTQKPASSALGSRAPDDLPYLEDTPRPQNPIPSTSYSDSSENGNDDASGSAQSEEKMILKKKTKDVFGPSQGGGVGAARAGTKRKTPEEDEDEEYRQGGFGKKTKGKGDFGKDGAGAGSVAGVKRKAASEDEDEDEEEYVEEQEEKSDDSRDFRVDEDGEGSGQEEDPTPPPAKKAKTGKKP